MENGENKDLQGRREFFKNASKKALPLFAIALLGSSVLSSCTKDNGGGGGSGVSGCGNSCSGSCKESCSGGCSGGCSGSCDDNCTADCWNGCNRWQN